MPTTLPGAMEGCSGRECLADPEEILRLVPACGLHSLRMTVLKITSYCVLSVVLYFSGCEIENQESARPLPAKGSFFVGIGWG